MSQTIRLVGRADQPTEPNASVTVTLDLSANQTLQVATTPCRIFGVLVVTQPTGAVSFYDGTNTSGTLIGLVAANTAAGTFVPFLDGGMPANKGLFASGATAVGKLTLALGL